MASWLNGLYNVANNPAQLLPPPGQPPASLMVLPKPANVQDQEQTPPTLETTGQAGGPRPASVF